MKRIFIFTLIVVVNFQLFAQDATQWRGTNRDGIYYESGLLTEWPVNGPELLWHFDDLGPGHASAAIANGKIYTAGTSNEEGFVIALNMDGEELWKTKYGKEWVENWDGVRSTPAINDGLLYIMSGYGLLSCIDAESGKIIWKKDLLSDFDGQNIKWGVTENLLIYDDFLICTPGGQNSNIIALNKKSGNVIWECQAKGDVSAYGSPQLINHNGLQIIVAHSASFILGINALNGKMLWSFEWPNQWSVHPNTPLYYKGKIFTASGYGKGSVQLKLSPDGGLVTEVWQNEAFDNQMGGYVLLDGKLYGAGSKSRKWLCVDWETGETLYEYSDLKVGNIIAAEDLLYWYSQGGEVALVKPEADKFNIVGQFDVPFGDKQHWAHLVIYNKRLYVRHGSSLMVYNIAK